MKFNCEIIIIHFNHGLIFDNLKFLEFCATNHVDNKFYAPRTLQQNCVVKCNNRTLEDIA